MKRILFILTVILLVTGYSCKKINNNTNQYSIDSAVNIEFMETETTYGGATTLTLGCSSGVFFNSGMVLNYNIATNNNNITIHFTNISGPNGATFDGCNCPATAIIDLGVLNAGAYNLNVVINGITHSGTLAVSDSNYIISLSAPGLSLINNSLNKLPVNTIWGYVSGKNRMPYALINTIIDSLTGFGAVPYMGTSGNYYMNGNMFTIYSGDSISIGNIPYSRQFIYRYYGSYNKIDTLLKNNLPTDTTYVRIYY